MKTGLGIALAALLATGQAYAAGTTLNVGMASADAGKLDPHVATSTPDKGLLHWMFNGLVRIKPGEASPEFIEPDIASSWTTSDDGLTWVFSLRDDVECHGDYGKIDAEDVVYSLKRSANTDISAFAKDYTAFDSVEATGPLEVTIKLKNKIPSLLGLLVLSASALSLPACDAAAATVYPPRPQRAPAVRCESDFRKLRVNLS